jgi:hypothetical protein
MSIAARRSSWMDVTRASRLNFNVAMIYAVDVIGESEINGLDVGTCMAGGGIVFGLDEKDGQFEHPRGAQTALIQDGSGTMDQGYRAACALAGVDECGEHITSIIAPRIYELLQLG